MKKKLLALLLVSMMAFSVSACSVNVEVGKDGVNVGVNGGKDKEGADEDDADKDDADKDVADKDVEDDKTTDEDKTADEDKSTDEDKTSTDDATSEGDKDVSDKEFGESTGEDSGSAEAGTEIGDGTEGTTGDEVIVDDTVVAEGWEMISNVTFSLCDKWTFNDDINGTRRYNSANGLEVLAIYVQNTDLYLKDEMLAAYENQIITVFGENGTVVTETIGGREWRHYTYTADNKVTSGAGAEIYLYSDGFTTIYVEDAYSLEQGAASGDVIPLLESMTFDEYTGGGEESKADGEKFGSVSYTLTDDWFSTGDTAGMKIYQSTAGEVFGIYVSEFIGLTAEYMISEYSSTVETTYGSNYVKENITVGELDWVRYTYGGDNMVIANYGVEAYIFSNGNVTIYIEYTYPEAAGSSESFKTILESMKIE